MDDPVVGNVLGAWRVVRLLGRGGMGTVYLAERADGQFEQQAALKVITAGAWDAGAVERFRTERQLLARLAHPNIARLLDGGIAPDGRPYLVMELVAGAAITAHCAARGLATAARLRLFQLACEAMQHAHGALVVHCDLKPANTLVSEAGEVKLVDFGVARLVEPHGGAVAPAGGGSSPLTPEYAAPELLRGGPITTAADVYSLGVMLHELLCGARPRPRADGTVAAPRRGDDLDAIVLTALRAQPERRYVSAGQLGEDIGRFLDGLPVLARPDSLAYRARRLVGRNRGPVAAAALVALALAGFAVLSVWQTRRAAAERDAAELERGKAEQVVGLLVDLFETTNPNVRPDGDRLPLRQLVADSEARVLGRLEGQPEVRARMRQVFGLIHGARGQYADGRAALEQALAEEERLLGREHPETIETLHQLGVLVRHLGDEARARALLAESLARCRRAFGDEHVKTARALAALASEQRLDEAQALFEEALRIHRKLLAPDDPELALSLARLGAVHMMRGRLERARAYYLEAQAVFTTPEARRHPAAITIASDYATLLDGLGERDAAETQHREALAAARQTFGDDSFEVAHRLNNLAVALAERGRVAEAETLFREAFERHLALLGPDH